MSIIAKYKFDKSIYADLLPEFNAEFTSDKYNTTDEEVDGIITRTIESDELPTLMRFGRLWIEGESTADNRTDSLLEILDMNTSGLTDCNNMFRYCANLTSITCEWDTSNVINMYSMFNNCTNLTSLDVSNWNTSNVTNMYAMFHNCQSLTALDVSNFDTSNVTRMDYMFWNCNKLTTLDIGNFNTSKVTRMDYMFTNCANLATLDVSNFDTSKVTNMEGMFNHCNNLTTLDVSNFDTSKVTNMSCMFNYCQSLTSLDVSNFDISSVVRMDGMFSAADKLVSLDISNFSISDTTNIDYIFSNTPLLTDIGMLYCDQSTINKAASVLPTNTTQTIWVEDVDIKDLTPVEGVEFKQYAKNTEIMLTSPLLEGDKLVVKDGKLYHYHKMGMVVLDGSEQWVNNANVDTDLTKVFSILIENTGIPDAYRTSIVNTLPTGNAFAAGDYECTCFIGTGETYCYIRIFKSKLSTQDVNGFKQWLQANPTTVVYELVKPYYELISEDPLTISLIAESSDIINSSNIPLNMTINNKGLSTIAMSPSTTYTVAFDKDTDSEVVVNLCGNEITTTDNVVEITTPSEIDDELIFYGDGVEVSNVRLLEGSVSGDSVPRESFKGLKNSFEDGYIPENELVDFPKDIYLNGSSFQEGNGDGCNVYYHTVSLKTNTVYTVFCNINEETTCTDGIGLRLVVEVGDKHYNIISGDLTTMKGVFCSTFTLTKELRENKNLELWNRDTGIVSISNMVILEGDWTHLTEEDWNNLGKYKVDYKVTGKNKFNSELELGDLNGYTGVEQNSSIRYRSKFISVIPNTQYTITHSNSNTTINSIYEYDKNKNFIQYINTYPSYTSSNETYYIRFKTDLMTDNIQLEEGTQATEYEPYKSYTKTFYLNSPLLEGDTIEDINGVATHVRRWEKIILDGSEDWKVTIRENNEAYYFTPEKVGKMLGDVSLANPVYSDSLITRSDNPTNTNLFYNSVYAAHDGNICMIYNNLGTSGIKQWLSENPVTVVYELASPIYEPISTESILCDSYVNGHLDVDTNIPIEKVYFDYLLLALKYVKPSTRYLLQFESDNVGISTINIGGSTVSEVPIIKGINKVEITTLSTLTHQLLAFSGIGFNASNIQVVATDRDADFGYFKGLQSSFENNMENLWDGTLVEGVHITNSSTYSNTVSKTRSACIKCRPNTTYIITATNNDRLRIGHVSELVDGIVCMISDIDDTNIRYKEFTTTNREGYLVVYVANEKNTNENITVDIREKTNEVKCKVVGKNKAPFIKINCNDVLYTDIVLKKGTTYTISSNLPIATGDIKINKEFTGEGFRVLGQQIQNWGEVINTFTSEYSGLCRIWFWREDIHNQNVLSSWIQIEEGTQATSYEPYQEYTKTIYLNSPLLKGDTIEVHNGKLCHYHKMGKVVLDGSEDWDSSCFSDGGVSDANTAIVQIVNWTDGEGDNNNINVISDNFSGLPAGHMWVNDIEGICLNAYNILQIRITKSKLSTTDVNGFKQWLSENPTTVVYQLAEPYYKEITPTQEDLIITSVKEGDLHIDTIVPISSKVTYNVNVQLLTDFEQSIVEQVQATQTTDLQSILDEEIDN